MRRRGAGRTPARGRRLREPVWLYGRHAVEAALANPARRIRRLLVAREAGETLAERLTLALRARDARLRPERPAREDIERRFGRGTVHQGIALEAHPLPPARLDDACGEVGRGALAVCLDQVTDPQNVGATLRAAAAFGASFLVIPSHHAPGESAALAKAASGALERIPVVRAASLAASLDRMREAGFFRVGLDPEAGSALRATRERHGGRFAHALVLGAEGRGLRPGTRKRCDDLCRIPIRTGTGSLNVATACAVALYEFARTGPGADRDGGTP